MLVTANVFQPLIDVFETVLKFFHNSGGIPWGWSIVLLTIAVRAVLVPITFRQIKSMVRMQGFAPQMKEIQQKYKQDKQRQQQEMMKFYKENNVNPLGSCLPMVLQLPVFISLYYMLRKSLRSDICPNVQIAHQKLYAAAHHVSAAKAAAQTVPCGHSAASHFLFVTDLTAKAKGIELGVLIVLYVGSQLGSSLLMSAASMDANQRRIMLFMPLIFVLFVIRFPAGVLVYWITTNLWTILQQYVVKKRIGPVRAANVALAGDGGAAAVTVGSGPGGGSGGGGGLGAKMFDRLRAAQENAQATRSGDGVAKNGGRGNGTSAPAKTPTAGKSLAERAGARRSGNGATAAKSDNGSGSAKAGNGSGGAAAARSGPPPPRPPRKKKKRSGRRR